MARMTAAAAVRVLELEGITTAFGVPGAAINPFYAAMKPRIAIRHILARHVEGASHMAEGYTRASAGNIGLCVGTSGPAGTDMITGLYSASADSVPILCVTGQAPRAKMHKEDFQAVDIEAIAKPVCKWAVTVREPALVPRTFQQAFHVMRSGRPGPVLIDLPFDVQVAEIEFDEETYSSLPVYKPQATRAQAEKALAMLNEAERLLTVAGGAAINADASGMLVRFAEITGIPVIPTLVGWSSIPDDHALMAGMVGLQTSYRYGNATMLASDFVLGIGNRWANRHTGSVETYTRGRKFVHVDAAKRRQGLRVGARGGRAGRSRHHHGSRHAPHGSRAVRCGRHGRGLFARQGRGGHELRCPGRHQGVARRIRERGCDYLDAPVSRGRRGRRGGQPDHHGRRPAGHLRPGQALVRADGQEHHPCRRQRRRADNEGCQPDHRGADHRCGGRGAAVRFQGRRRSGACKGSADGGFANSRILEVHGERMVKRNFEPGFRIGLHQKDLNLALSGARMLGISLPNTATCQELFNACAVHGGAAWDHSAMVRALEIMSNHRVASDHNGTGMGRTTV